VVATGAGESELEEVEVEEAGRSCDRPATLGRRCVGVPGAVERIDAEDVLARRQLLVHDRRRAVCVGGAVECTPKHAGSEAVKSNAGGPETIAVSGELVSMWNGPMCDGWLPAERPVQPPGRVRRVRHRCVVEERLQAARE
jgi:hypothetical protein